jgi:intein/homing endonuclease
MDVAPSRNQVLKSRSLFKSRGSLKSIHVPPHSAELAEIVGIILGDGNLYRYIKSKTKRAYVVRIAGHVVEDREYLEDYVAPLLEKLFHVSVKKIYVVHHNELFLAVYRKELVDFFEAMGLMVGKKKILGASIPAWILENDGYLRACIRGLIDTDGSIHRMSKRDFKLLRIEFTSYYPQLMADMREGLIKLGFHPSKVICKKHFFLSRQSEIARYLKEVGFANKKHQQRFFQFSAP